MAEPVLSLVVWDDAHGDSSTMFTVPDAHLQHKATVMQTVGWVVLDDTSGISIANERCFDQGDEYYRGRTFIPRSLVRSCTPIIKPRMRRTRHPPAPEGAPP